jgi:hypothetical protein
MRAGALEDAGHHRRGRRLAVGGRDDGAAALQAGTQARDGVGLQAHEQLARQRRAPRPVLRDSAPAARAAATLTSRAVMRA